MPRNVADRELYEQAEALLEPGEIELDGLIVYSDLDTDEEARLHQQTIEIGNFIAEHAAPDVDTYVYSGNDDPEFGLNQHQCLTIDGDEFVWECQQLRREGGFVIVFYFEGEADLEAIAANVRDAGYTVDAVEG